MTAFVNEGEEHGIVSKAAFETTRDDDLVLSIQTLHNTSPTVQCAIAQHHPRWHPVDSLDSFHSTCIDIL